MSELLDYHIALNDLLQTHAPLHGEESVPLEQLHQRVLSRDVLVQHDVPAFDNSAMDGYAINDNARNSWQIVQRIAAGDQASKTLEPGQAARIFTGAPVPAGATAVVMQEMVAVSEDGQFINYDPAQGAISEGLNIRRKAEELQQGSVLLARHQRITPAAIGLLSAQGYTHAPCVPRVRVTVFSSGNELVKPGSPLQPGQIYDSNREMLLAMLRAEGFEAVSGGILPDQLEATKHALQKAAAESHAIICSGGVSVGEEDHLKAALQQVGELTQWRLLIKPGKPFTWGHIAKCRVFMLPGNPVSSLVTFRQLALPALQRLAGLDAEQARPWRLPARAAFSRSKADSRREFLRVKLQASARGLYASPMQQQGSNMLSGAAFADALAEIPPGTPVQEGMELVVYPLGAQFSGDALAEAGAGSTQTSQGDTLTHFDARGQAWMVDVGGKPSTRRRAIAQGSMTLSPAAFHALRRPDHASPKGDVLGVARIAAIQGAKQTSSLIPLCHPLPLTHVSVEFHLDDAQLRLSIEVRAETEGKTGVEMEALTAASVGLLTVYDMLKAIDKGMVIESIALLRKEGGKSGTWERGAGL